MNGLQTLKRKVTKKDIPFVIAAVLISWYVSMCLAHYMSARPLWNDEWAVSLSLEQFASRDFFTRPLFAVQMFPRLYLFLIQKISHPFDFHLLSLRFLSFVFMLSAYFLWMKIARYEMKDNKEYWTFLLCWCASIPMVYYAAELKQYSMDVLAGAIFLYFIYRQEYLQSTSRLRLNIFLVLLPALGLLSYTAFLFCLFPFTNMLVSAKKDKTLYRSLVLFCASCVIFALLSFFFDMRFRPGAVMMPGGHAEYFISFKNVPEFFRSFGEGTNNLFSRFFAERPRVIKKIARCFLGFGFIFLFYGFFKNFKKDGGYLKSLNTIAFILYLELFALGALHLYPFTEPRTSLVYCPFIFYLTIKGIGITKRINKYFYGILHAAFIIFLMVVALCISRIVYSGQELSFAPFLW
ncbi:MAG: hypothetical protein ABIJ41_06580 [Candidatus Omnitrophota bacterium]